MFLGLFALILCRSVLCFYDDPDFFSAAKAWQTSPTFACDNPGGPTPSLFANMSTLVRYSAFLQIFSNMKIPCSGMLVRWTIMQNGLAVGKSVYLDVWRLLEDNSTYAMVATHRITITSPINGLRIYPIPTEEQYHVQKGDILGIHYDSTSTPMADRVVPYLELEDVGPTSTTSTHLWQLQHNDLESSKFAVSVFDALVLNQQRAPALFVNVETFVSQESRSSFKWPWSSFDPILQVKVGNLSFVLRANDTEPLWAFLLAGGSERVELQYLFITLLMAFLFVLAERLLF